MKRMMQMFIAAALTAFGVGAAHADIVIASAGPFTGSYAAFGEQLKRGATQAVADLNAAGGVLGQKLKLEYGDDACDPKQAVSVANKFANQKVVFVSGHFCSGSSIPASEVYKEENILQISPASTNPKLTEQGFFNVFRTCGRDDQQGPFDGDFIVDNFKGKRVAIVHDKQTYSKGLADEVKKQLNKRGTKEVLYDTVTAGEKDYSALVTKLKANNVEVLFYGGYHTEGGLIVRQMREQGLKARMVAGDALFIPEFWSITGNAGEGTLASFSPDPRNNKEAAAVVKKFRDQGYEPEGYTLYSYAAVQAWAQAAATAKSTDAKKVAAALKSGTFSTVLGKISFDKKGDIKGETYMMYEWTKGALKPIKKISS
ncbi:MAG TPA: branched-chain amino acid ABC transporter substrate-binding protein [Rhodospirillales bacterium]